MVNTKHLTFESVLNPYNYSNSKYIEPATKMTNYNIIRQKPEKLLKGKKMKMGLNFRAVAVNGTVVTQKNLERQQAISQQCKQGLWQLLLEM